MDESFLLREGVLYIPSWEWCSRDPLVLGGVAVAVKRWEFHNEVSFSFHTPNGYEADTHCHHWQCKAAPNEWCSGTLPTSVFRDEQVVGGDEEWLAAFGMAYDYFLTPGTLLRVLSAMVNA